MVPEFQLKRFVFFTKTDWNEPPRLRHQLANLLTAYGNTIIFFEKPSLLFPVPSTVKSASRAISFQRTQELIHHKLRLNGLLCFINAFFESILISNKSSRLGINDQDIIVNFNYDYCFLRSIFPRNNIITIINDDFWCRALLRYQRPLRSALARTCQASDQVFAVSDPLLRDLCSYCSPKLLLPWADGSYESPNPSSKRNRLLFWGYINDRLNFDYIIKLLNLIASENLDLFLDFVGPVCCRDSRLKTLSAHPNFKLVQATSLENLDIDSVLAAFIPYVAGNRADDVTSLPNKAFPMLSKGLPILITGMPNFIELPFVFRLDKGMNNDLALIASLEDVFFDLQTAIMSFVNANSSHERYAYLMRYF